MLKEAQKAEHSAEHLVGHSADSKVYQMVVLRAGQRAYSRAERSVDLRVRYSAQMTDYQSHWLCTGRTRWL